MSNQKTADLLARLDTLTPQEVKRYLVQELTRKKLGLTWEADFIERDAALNSNMVFPELVAQDSLLDASETSGNLIIEGDNFDSLRLLKATHAGKIRVILIDPPYNTGNKDWVYNDSYLNKNNRWKHSTWLEFMYQRMVLARDLLTPDGVILICINDENRSRLELMMDEVMPSRRIGSFVWRSRTGGNDAKGAFFSDNHEHVLVFANSEFRFSGEEKSYSIYKHEENDRLFYLGDLAKAHDYKERPNTYYPIHDPESDIWYPCNPGRVWAYASKKRVAPGQKLRGKTIEDLIEDGQVWFPVDQKVSKFDTLDELIAAVTAQDVPYSGSTPLLTLDTPDLQDWVGRKIGFGRPRLKKFKDGLKNENTPISSWLTPRTEADTADETLNMPIVGATEEGSRTLKEVMGGKSFSYPKPPSLIKNLLAQASSKNDTILDFFAGSGTTGHAVLALNAEDNGNRKFILCSSTEATPKEPDKNLCLDVCAERIRNVIKGYGKTDGLHGDFAYLKLTLMEEADLPFEATAAHAYITICMRETGHVRLPEADSVVWPVAINVDSAVVMCPTLTDEACAALEALGVRRLVVYTDRPDRLQDMLADSLLEVTTYSLEDALRWGQSSRLNDSSAALEVEL